MNNELDELAIRTKEKIKDLISNQKLHDAEALIDGYFKVFPEDAEACSLNAVIKILKCELDEAEKILNQGLRKFPFYKDLLFNMSYLYDLKNDYLEAIQYYCMGKLFHNDYRIKVDDIIQNSKSTNKSKQLNVIHGTMEIANQMNTISQGLKQLGVNSQTINYYPSYLGYKSDYELNINSFKDINTANIKSKNLASKIIGKTDIFHFHFGTSLTLDYSDLPVINDLNKKAIMQYWGSDVRLYSKAIKLNPYVKVKNMNEDSIKRNLEYISKLIPDCLVDYELAEYVKDFHSRVHLTRVALDLRKYEFIKETNNDKLLIVHAPTSPEYKGTSYILKAIEELSIDYDFDFKLVQGMSHEDALKIYEKADLIIDQILGGGYGVFAVESMAMGKPVISWISDFMKERYPRKLPIISANPDNIKSKIEYVINNKDMLKEAGRKGRMYVEEYHDKNIISQSILEIYKGL